ncbi:integrative and conjugative element protein (TIGR02256 family) [Bradyrhizobium elkanii]
MHMQRLTAWISSRSLEIMGREADRLYPLETGGVLIGYWADDTNVVVTAEFGPGPAAIHKRYSYKHDHAWEAARVASEYERSERTHVYIGDWHTHPNASSGRLSGTDKRSLRTVLGSQEARLRRTLMVVLFGTSTEWQPDIWAAELGRASIWNWRRSLLIEPVLLRRYT